MRMLGALVAIAVFGAPLAGGVPKARAAALPKGTIEIAPSLAFSHNSLSLDGADAGSATTLTGSGLLGVCVSGQVEVEGGLLVDHRSLDSPGATSEHATSFGVLGGVRVNLGHGGRVIPYVRGAAGIATHSGNLSFGEETSVLAPILASGVRLLVGNSASFNVEVDYQRDANAFGLSGLTGSTFALGIGLSIFRHMKR